MTNRSLSWVCAGVVSVGLVWHFHKPSAEPVSASSTATADMETLAPAETSHPTAVENSVAANQPAAESATAPTPSQVSGNEKKKLSAAEVKKQMDKFEERFEQFNRCYSENCVPAEVHPRTAYYEAGQSLKLELMVLKSFVEETSLTDSRVTDIALRALENSDGHVQTVALDLLASQPPSTENMDAILDKVVRGSDAEMIGQAFHELQRYSSAVEQEKIHQALAEELVTGSPFVSEAIAENIQPFLNAKSISVFETVLEKIGPGSKIYDQLQTSIQEFRRQQG